MISIVIFAIGVISVMYLFPMGARDIGKARELTAATYLGQAKMEEMLLSTDIDTPQIEPEGSFAPAYPGLYYSVTRSYFPSNKRTMMLLSVEVYKLSAGSERKRIVHYDSLKGIGGSIEKYPEN